MDIKRLKNIEEEVNELLTRILACINNAADLLDFGMDKDEMRESLDDASREVIKAAKLINDRISGIVGEVGANG